ncbi:MAG: hypothetical protein AAB403_09115 [Planctomycetota bacterium]
MAEDVPNTDVGSNLEFAKLELEREKAKLDYRKFLWGSVVAAIAVATIPPSFQLATAALEYVKSRAKLAADTRAAEADRQVKQEQFHQTFTQAFIANALDQDIELRIRFAEYFAHVSPASSRDGWGAYLQKLVKRRDEVRTSINEMEEKWQKSKAGSDQAAIDVDRLERTLQWTYKEVGYVSRDRSVTTNPRAPEDSRVGKDPMIESLSLRPTARAAAYELKRLRPEVVFTAGRRDKAAHARAMAEPIVQQRNWISNTYSPNKVTQALQQWVSSNPQATEQDIAAGLLSIMNPLTDSELALMSRHLSGDAFDIQPIEPDNADVKGAIKALPGLRTFLEREGGLVRWHVEFKE